MYENLLKPIMIGHLMLRNRIIASPMGGKEKDYYGLSLWEKSLGGSAMVHLTDSVDLFEKYTLEKTREAINVARQDGARVALEINFLQPVPDKEGNLYAPDEGMRYDNKYAHRMERKQMNQFRDRTVYYAVNARKIGFDAVTLEFGHDSFLCQFLSPGFNHRQDEYGGSLDNRIRYPLEVLKAVRAAVGRDFPLILRVSRQLMLEESYSEDDMLYFLKQCEGLVELVNISTGMDCYGGVVEHYESNVHAIPTIFEPHNYSKDFARRVKENTSHKVAIVGAVVDPVEADKLIEEGYTDAVFVGRSLTADPYWPRKLMAGHPEDIVPCLRCQQCYHVSSKHWNVQCSVNPLFNRRERQQWSRPLKEDRKHVIVIGGGVAGMVAALAADKQGHQVTLIERDDKLGGLLNVASLGIYKQDLRRYLQYLITQISKSGIKVMLNTVAERKLIEELKGDKLIICVGSSARRLKLKGAEKMIEVTEAMKDPESLGNRVVIIGGGSTGMEFGLELAVAGHEVTVIEMTDKYASNGNELYRGALRQHVNRQNNLRVMLNTRCLEITEATVKVVTEGREEEVAYDSVINASGRVANPIENLYGIIRDTVVAGDCDRVGTVCDAVNLAYYLGKNA
ncbi:MAG: FAD-dependent oxidoreductase [Erysipelotrichaceae bacterium]|nr:FAD-dependent oxidoreductase [Erysipelotrichaceae bacterium]